MHSLSRFTASLFLSLLIVSVKAAGQEPQRWFSSNEPQAYDQSRSVIAGSSDPYSAGPNNPYAAPPNNAYGPVPGNPYTSLPTTEGGGGAAMEADLNLQPPNLADQLSALGKRVEALEKPPVRYPAGVQVLGVFQVDGVMFNQDAANKLPTNKGGVMSPIQPAGITTIQNGADFRRARLAAKASLGNNINAFMQFDFAFPGRPTFTDVWVEYTDLPFLGTVRVGQWKQPFSLEVVSSFRYTTFMERSSLFQAFTPFRHIGIGAYDHAEDLMATWAYSYIRTGQDQFGGSLSTRGGNGFTGRVTRLAWYDEDAGRSYLHLGGDYFFNSPPLHAIAFRTIPEIFVGQNANGGTGTAGFASPLNFDGTPFFAHTRIVTDVTGVNTYDLEALWVHGPLAVQSEAMAAQVNREGRPSSLLHGEYMQVGWFLTGEHRPYDRIAGAIDRVRPFEDFFWVRDGNGSHQHGLGAWEVAVRYSHLDLDDKSISGGVLDDITFGVNWYTNAYTKIVFNYIHMWRQSPTTPPSPPLNGPAVAVNSEANAFGLRAQMDF